VRYAEEVRPDFTIDGVETLKTGRYGVKLQFDTQTTPVDSVLIDLTRKGGVVDITISDPPLEEVIAKIYQEAQAYEQPAA
jgi:ABC-2 type transport system ATP-binding protein